MPAMTATDWLEYPITIAQTANGLRQYPSVQVFGIKIGVVAMLKLNSAYSVSASASFAKRIRSRDGIRGDVHLQ